MDFKLGQYQIEWLKTKGEIKLRQWRFINGEFLYVGDWKPNENDIGKSYKLRNTNLEKDPYFYW